MYLGLFQSSLWGVFLKIVYFNTRYWMFFVVYFRARYGMSTFPPRWRSGFWPLVSPASPWPLSETSGPWCWGVPESGKEIIWKKWIMYVYTVKRCFPKWINMNLVESWFKILLLLFVGFREKTHERRFKSSYIIHRWIVWCPYWVFKFHKHPCTILHLLQVVIVIYFTYIRTSLFDSKGLHNLGLHCCNHWPLLK